MPKATEKTQNILVHQAAHQNIFQCTYLECYVYKITLLTTYIHSSTVQYMYMHIHSNWLMLMKSLLKYPPLLVQVIYYGTLGRFMYVINIELTNWISGNCEMKKDNTCLNSLHRVADRVVPCTFFIMYTYCHEKSYIDIHTHLTCQDKTKIRSSVQI